MQTRVTTPPTIDVLIPVFNGAATVREAVESILSQTVRDIRVIIVDDGSTDATPAILRELATKDPRILVLTKPNGGIVDTLNAGLARCEAEFLARFDADDIAFPDRLAWQLEYLQSNPDCVAVGGGVEHIDEHGKPLLGLPHPGQPTLADATSAPAVEPYLMHPYLMVRRAAIVRAGGYRHVHNSEDSDLFWRLSEFGRLHNLERTLGQYRVHTDSISSASIVNGRIMAVSSQLAAMSALRRKAGKPDLVFAQKARDEYRAIGTLEGMCNIASRDLDAHEAQHLRIAAATKLMELARYRPYEIEKSDCAFIRASLPYAARLSAQNQNEVRWYVTVTAARLLRSLKIAEALALSPPKDLPIVVARTLLSRGGKKVQLGKA